MATQTIKWLPSTSPNIVAYTILKSDTGIAGPYTQLTQLLNMISGPNWLTAENCFFYNDDLVPYRWYQIQILDQYGNSSAPTAPTPFQAGNSPVATPSLYVTALTENTGGANNLQYVTQGGTPISGATIRVYRKLDWDTKQYSKVIGTAVTAATGGWAAPVFVEPGETYTIVFEKTYEYGPDRTEITV
jgi:hypothetical protein